MIANAFKFEQKKYISMTHIYVFPSRLEALCEEHYSDWT